MGAVRIDRKQRDAARTSQSGWYELVEKTKKEEGRTAKRFGEIKMLNIKRYGRGVVLTILALGSVLLLQGCNSDKDEAVTPIPSESSVVEPDIQDVESVLEVDEEHYGSIDTDLLDRLALVAMLKNPNEVQPTVVTREGESSWAVLQEGTELQDDEKMELKADDADVITRVDVGSYSFFTSDAHLSAHVKSVLEYISSCYEGISTNQMKHLLTTWISQLNSIHLQTEETEDALPVVRSQFLTEDDYVDAGNSIDSVDDLSGDNDGEPLDSSELLFKVGRELCFVVNRNTQSEDYSDIVYRMLRDAELVDGQRTLYWFTTGSFVGVSTDFDVCAKLAGIAKAVDAEGYTSEKVIVSVAQAAIS